MAAMKRLRLSGRKASDLAGMSEGRWRQIVNGYQNPTAGVFIAVTGKADTLARMAKVVGVTSDDLQKAGRADAADELRALLDAEIEAEHGHKSSEQLQSETDEIADDLREVLVRHGLDPASRQMRILEPAIVGMAEMMLRFTEFTQGDDKGAESGHPKVDNDV